MQFVCMLAVSNTSQKRVVTFTRSSWSVNQLLFQLFETFTVVPRQLKEIVTAPPLALFPQQALINRRTGRAVGRQNYTSLVFAYVLKQFPSANDANIVFTDQNEKKKSLYRTTVR